MDLFAVFNLAESYPLSSRIFLCTSLLPITGRKAHSVTCLAADMCLTADQGVPSSIPGRSHTFVEIDHEIISRAILLPSADSRRVVVSYKRKYIYMCTKYLF